MALARATRRSSQNFHQFCFFGFLLTNCLSHRVARYFSQNGTFYCLPHRVARPSSQNGISELPPFVSRIVWHDDLAKMGRFQDHINCLSHRVARRSSQNTTFQNLDLAPSDPKGLLKLSSFLWTLGFGLPRGITNLRVSIDNFGQYSSFSIQSGSGSFLTPFSGPRCSVQSIHAHPL